MCPLLFIALTEGREAESGEQACGMVWRLHTKKSDWKEVESYEGFLKIIS